MSLPSWAAFRGYMLSDHIAACKQPCKQPCRDRWTNKVSWSRWKETIKDYFVRSHRSWIVFSDDACVWHGYWNFSLARSLSLSLIKKHAILPRLWIFSEIDASINLNHVVMLQISKYRFQKLLIIDAWFCSSSSWGASHELDMNDYPKPRSLRQKNRIIPLKLNHMT